MGKRKPAPSYTPPPRASAVWEEAVPTIDDRVTMGHLSDIRDAMLKALIAMPEGGARQALADAVHTLAGVGTSLDTLDSAIDGLQAHADKLQEACAAIADRAAEADEIREAIERHPGTAPGVWADALRIARSGGPLRDMWCGGKS